jgi:hypothetical protein
MAWKMSDPMAMACKDGRVDGLEDDGGADGVEDGRTMVLRSVEPMALRMV